MCTLTLLRAVKSPKCEQNINVMCRVFFVLFVIFTDLQIY